ncbi:hypothetical protein Ddye_012211 [Dipteronia dyeriana]|uniref:Reverse transcriptase domain-containing protein n=1 Tax=Dipteronia dyeriana TaxID=168575 RepID=A0AAD9X413_9ROSI|nr:hypothetical protein Ddye_012211 [Dipteronia dyeriana]
MVAFCNMYAPSMEKYRKELWDFILNAIKEFPIPWCIVGDFNILLDPSESAKVVDIPLSGMAFTWTNSRGNAVWARLDRLLLSLSLLVWFPKLTQRGLSRSLSNHCLILLGEPSVDWGLCPFWFYNCWLEDSKIMKDATDDWKWCVVKGLTRFYISAKLKVSKVRMKRWLAQIKKDSFSMKGLMEHLADVDKVAMSVGWSEVLRKSRSALLSDLLNGIRREEIEWTQKSRVKWLNEGDSISKLFHFVANGRKRDSLSVKKLNVADRGMLEEDFSCSEVWEALSGFDGNKSPGLDGLNLNFIKVSWEFVREDVMVFMKDFYKDSSIVKDINKTFIALIPKVKNPTMVGDFRHISLVASIYKILFKVLSNRIKKVMDSIIGEFQMAFVKGMQIIDIFVITEEIINKWKMEKVGVLVVKIDFEKTYNSVDHAFLDAMMESKVERVDQPLYFYPDLFCFGQRQSHPTIPYGKGLRQGDPLSPIIFNIVVESLSCLIIKVADEDFGSSEVNITHLQFIDNTIFFIKPKEEFVRNLRRILLCFELASGLKVNFHKSVGWEEVCRSKSKGGLGIGNVAMKNKGLLAKWVWRFRNEDFPYENVLFIQIAFFCYEMVEHRDNESWLDKFNWKGLCPPMVKLFVWQLLKGRVQEVGWDFMSPSHDQGRAWRTLFFAIVWMIWEARNKKVFHDEDLQLVAISDSVKFLVGW